MTLGLECEGKKNEGGVANYVTAFQMSALHSAVEGM
jgi:hypothetical protein